MSVIKRAIEEIQAEYQATCTRLGHIRYQISAFEDDIKLVLAKLKDLNLEAVSVQAAKTDTPAQEQPTPPAQDKVSTPTETPVQS